MSSPDPVPYRWWRSAILVAGFDLSEALRSRRALVLIVLYVAGATGAALLFAEVLREVESVVASTLAVPATENPGAMTTELMANERLLDVIAGLVGDRALAETLLGLPPLSLFYGWLGFLMLPWVVVIGSGDAIAADLGSGACRYPLVRVDRTSWAVGRLLGQAALMAVGVALGALAVWIVGWVRLGAFQPLVELGWLVRLSARAWVHGFAWLGVALGISQITRSVHRARAATLAALVLGSILGAALGSELVVAEIPNLAPALRQLYPGAWRLELWQPDPVRRLTAAIVLLGQGVGAFSLGHMLLLRRDA